MTNPTTNVFAEAETIDAVLCILGGAASVCWSEMPTGVFDSDRALQLTQQAREVYRRAWDHWEAIDPPYLSQHGAMTRAHTLARLAHA